MYTATIKIILIDKSEINDTIKADNKSQFFNKLKEFGTQGYIDYANDIYYPPFQIKRIHYELY